ncbi:MAG: 2-amino-4-hydroxy-6-hydroxymethyldihydropteridine diphosphokinase [Candidatus Protochlamydia sp.]|nr:2-amino-4-hydroxy-6-hydroxymethyldihydropteridine diphosphokinase [Candidatus Protochlamydia sp.]
MSEAQLVYLSIGGNFEESHVLIKQAVSLLHSVAELNAIATSSLYETSPFEVASTKTFFNLVCSFWTLLPPRLLFEKIEAIENSLGKVPKPKSCDRPIDIDILFYGSRHYEDDCLSIPHPRWKERLFVLVPLLELASTIQIKQHKTIMKLDIQQMIDHLSKHTNDWANKINEIGDNQCIA